MEINNFGILKKVTKCFMNLFIKITTKSIWPVVKLLGDMVVWGFHGGSVGKESIWSAGDPGLIPGSWRSSGERNGNSLQYSCLRNPMDREAWWATVHGVTKSQKWLSDQATMRTKALESKFVMLSFTVATPVRTRSDLERLRWLPSSPRSWSPFGFWWNKCNSSVALNVVID